jgi:hypothetical protein
MGFSECVRFEENDEVRPWSWYVELNFEYFIFKENCSAKLFAFLKTQDLMSGKEHKKEKKLLIEFTKC